MCALQTLQAVGSERDTVVHQLSDQVCLPLSVCSAETEVCRKQYCFGCMCAWRAVLTAALLIVQKWRAVLTAALLIVQKCSATLKLLCVIRESNPGLYRGRVLFYH